MRKITPKIKRFILISFILVFSISALFSALWFLIPADYDITLDTPLKDATDIPIGVAVDVNNLETNEPYELLVRTHFNSIVPENVMKMGPLRPTVDTFFWDKAEYLVNYTESIGGIIHGHCLVWHQQLPDWLDSFSGTKEEWMDLLKIHIQTVVSHFKGRIASWDVVNEAIDGEEMRETIWLEKIGPEYVKYAFIWAHEADPDAILYYNDYSLITDSSKLEAVLTMLTGLIEAGVPIHGIGFQSHLTASFGLAQKVRAAVERINQEPLKVRISELDLQMNPNEIFTVYSVGLADFQAKVYEAIIREFMQIDRLEGITFWGLSDNHSWIRGFFQENDWPLLFDDNYNPKPAAERFLKVLKENR